MGLGGVLALLLSAASGQQVPLACAASPDSEPCRGPALPAPAAAQSSPQGAAVPKERRARVDIPDISRHSLSLGAFYDGSRAWGTLVPAKAFGAATRRFASPEAALARRKHHDRASSVLSYPSQPSPAFPAGVKVVVDPQEGFLAKVMMIRQAKRSVDLGTYIFTRDEVGYALLGELKAALARGVSVRVLVDSTGSIHPTHSELKALLAAPRGLGADGKRATVEVAVFNPVVNFSLIWRSALRAVERWFGGKDAPDRLERRRNRRSHDKLLIIDRDDPDAALAMVGGRNISGHYYGLPKVDADTYNDMEILLRGAGLAGTLGAHYDRLFLHNGNKVLRSNATHFADARQFAKMAEGFGATVAKNPAVAARLARLEAEGFLAKGFEPTEARFLNEIQNLSRTKAFVDPDHAGNRPNGDSIVAGLTERIKAAKRSVVFVSPYFYLEPGERAFFKKWLAEDPARTLTIISNSIATTDNLPAQAMVDLMAKDILENPDWGGAAKQVRVHAFGRLDSQELGGKELYGKLHAKYAVVDGAQAVVSTSNGDPRSRVLNSELGFLFGGEPAKRLAREAEILAARSYLWGSPEWKALRDRYPKKIAAEKVLMWWLKSTYFSQKMI